MDNPYQSPLVSCHAEPNRTRTFALVLCVVLLSVLLNARNAVQNWRELTPLHYLIGILLWLVLPLLAVLLLWRGRGAGRWILIVLFGLRGLGGLLIVGMLVVRHPRFLYSDWLLVEPLRSGLIDAMLYSAATAWFLISPSLRRIYGWTRPPAELEKIADRLESETTPPRS